MQFSGYSMVSRELKLRYRISKNPAHYEISAFGGKADMTIALQISACDPKRANGDINKMMRLE